MSVRLDEPLSTEPNADEMAMLKLLQGNILKGHGRHRTANVFLRFDPARAAEARQFLRENVGCLTTAKEQSENAKKVRLARQAGHRTAETRPFIACMLSYDGYEALGIDKARRPADQAFHDGMKAHRALLSDPHHEDWEAAYQGEIHAVIVIGGDPDDDDGPGSAQVDDALTKLKDRLPAGAVEAFHTVHGRAYFNRNGNAIEHFGYADGLSQPLFRQEDVKKADENGGTDRWNPAFPLRQVLVHDSFVANENAFGSYFVFRKLEQNVLGFKDAEKVLGRALARSAQARHRHVDSELAGARIIGRFEDGTPVLLQDEDGLHSPVPNNFDYSGDRAGLRCPFHSHIRKVNPRGETHRVLGVSLEEERRHMMPRRAITYGNRIQDHEKEFTDLPETGVGLLFMSFQSSITAQFEHIQANMANNEDFLRDGTGIDPIIGQGGNAPYLHRAGWGNVAAPKVRQDFAGFVTMKGGEYFFAPSIEFFRTL